MTYVVAILAGLVGAGAGWFASDLAYASFRDIVGNPGGLSILNNIDLHGIGAGTGLLLGTWVGLRFHGGHQSVRAVAWRGVISIAAGGLIVMGTLWLGGAMFQQLGMNAQTLSVEFEIRLPPTAKTPASAADIQVELHTDKNQALASVTNIGSDNARPVLRGNVPILFRTNQRRLVLSLSGEPVRVFRLFLPPNPLRNAEFGAWQALDARDQPGPATSNTPAINDYAIRYRAY